MIESIGMIFQQRHPHLRMELVRSYRHGEEPARIRGMRGRWSVHRIASAALQLAEEPVVHSRRPLWDLKHPKHPTPTTSRQAYERTYAVLTQSRRMAVARQGKVE